MVEGYQEIFGGDKIRRIGKEMIALFKGFSFL